MFGKQKTQLNIAYPQTYETFARKWSTVALVCAYVITSIVGGFVYQVTPAEAAIPKLINFQGKLTAVSNGSNVANGSYTFEFKLYDDPSAGSLLWTETWDGAPAECPQLAVAQGVFNAKLGSCNPLTGVDFTSGALYLSVNFNPGGGLDGEMTPRKQIVSSAYAFVANSVSGDGVVNNAIQSATALSTGRTLANPALQVDTNTASSATGLKVTSAAAAGGLALAVISSGTDENLTVDAKGAGTLSFGASSTGNVLLGGGSGSTGCTVTNTTGAFACTAGGSFTTMALTGAVTGATSYNGLVVTANTGVITSGTWNGTAVVDTYVADTLTIDSSSSVHWNALNNYPAACSAGSAISQLADTTNTCTAFNTDTSVTLQDAYDATSGNTITTTSARNIALTFAANTSITLDAATTDTTQTNGVIDLDVDSLTNSASAVDINFEGTGTTSSATQNGVNLTIVPSNATNARTYNGIKITNPDAGSLANTITGLNVDVTTANGSDTTYAALFNGGFVGIGTSTPGRLLHLNDTSGATAQLKITSNNAPAFEFETPGASDDYRFATHYTGTGDDFSVVDLSTGGFGTSRLSITNGNVGIGGTVSVSSGLISAANLTVLSAGSVGVGTTAPDKALEINSAAGNNLRLTYNDSNGSATNYADLLMSSGGDLTIAPSGGDTNITGTLAISSILQAGSATATTYSRLGTGTTGHSLGAADDLLITDDLEVDGDAFFDGNITIAGTCTGCGSGANTALSNLAAVAINTSLISDTDNTDALGSAAIGWSDLFLGSGGVINWNNGDAVLTHSAGVLTVSTGDLRVTTAGTNSASVVTVDGTQTLGNKTLTAPKFVNGGFIADANGNEQFIFNTTASAVNELSLTNAATGGVVALAATGGDTDVELSIDSKGADNLSLNGTATGNILFGGGSGSTGCTVTNSNGNFACTGTGTFSNLSGTNTGDVTLAAIGAVPNANGATLTGQVLNLQPASTSFGGVVTTGTQSFTGAKTFSGTGATNVIVSNGAATDVGGVLQLSVTSAASDFVPTFYSNRIVTGTGSLNAAYGIQNFVTSTAVVTGGGVGQTLYGDYNLVDKSGADTATGTYTSYATYNLASNTGRTNAGTVNTYGGYFSGVGDTAGTSTAIGLYATASGADNNYAAIFNAGNVGIGTTTPAMLLDVSPTNSTVNISASTIRSGGTFSGAVNSSASLSAIRASSTISSALTGAGTSAVYTGIESAITFSGSTNNDSQIIDIRGSDNSPVWSGTIGGISDAVTLYGSYNLLSSNLGTTGATDKYGVYSSVSGTADTSIGIYSSATGATTNYGLFVNQGTSYLADDVYVGALSETLSNTGFAMNGNDVFIEDKLGVEGSIYSDTSLIVGASTTYANGSISQSSGETLTIGTTSAALTLQTTTSGDINISPAGNVLLAGGSGSTGCTVTGTTGALACTSTIATGVAGGTIGGFLVSGNTSGTISILPQAAAGTYNFNLPTTAGSSGEVLTSAGGAGSAMTWTAPGALAVRWNSLIAPTGNLSLAHGASTTAFTFNSITSGSAFGLSSTSLTSGNLLQATGSGATMTTGGELIDLALGANTVGAGLTVTSTGTYTGVGAADGLINVTANGLTSGYAFQIPHTTSVVSGSLMRLSSTSADTSTIGSLLSLSSTASTAGTIAMITNNTASFTGTSFSVSNTGITSGAGIRVTGGSGMTTGGELVDLVLGANTVGAGLTVTSTGTYTGVGAADGLVNITANGLTSGYAFQIPHTTSVISGAGSLMRLSSTSVDTGTSGTLLSLQSSGSTAGTIAMITNNTASFTGISQSISNTGISSGTGLRVTGGSGMTTGAELIDLVLGSNTVGAGITITSIGTYTGTGAADGLINVVANALTSGLGSNYSFTGLTTGSAQRITGSGATMQTGGELIDLVLGANTVGAGLTITGTGAYTGTGAADGFLNIVGNSLTTGHGSKMSYTAITSGTGLLITGGSALTTNGELIDLNMSTSAGGQGINITNTGTYTGTGLIVMTANSATTGTILNQSATALTTGRAQSITLGTALTTGGLLSTTGASYLHTGSETGSLVSLAYTDASSNAAGAAVTNGILLSPTINTTASAGSKTINGISIAPTHTACGTTAGTCAYNGITQTTAAVTQTTTNALTITGNNIATAGALVQNTAAGSITWVGQNIQMPNITQTTGTVTSTGLKITGGTVTSGTAYALTTSSTAGNVGIGTTTPGSLLEVNGTAGFGFENLELNGGFESGSFTSAYSDLADGGSGTLTVTSGGGWEGTYFVRNSAQVGGHAFRLRPTFVIPTSTASLSYYGRRNGVANSWGSSPANGVVTPITVYLYDETSATTVCNTGSNSPGTNWTRYNVSCSVTAGHTFSVQVMMDGWSGQYNADIDAVQVEAGLAVMEYGAPLKLSTNGGGYIMGNVGIGTGTVDKKLHIAETVTGIAYSLKLDNYHSSTDDATGILFSVQGDGSHNFLSGRGKGGLVYAMPSGATWNRGDFYFLQDATADNSNPTLADASMVIKNSGDIGIGEVNPTTAKLVINQTDAANLPGIYINSEESTTTQSVFSIESDTATGSGADTVKFKITADGSVYSDANVYGTPADVAEMYNISGPVTAGDVVEIVAMTGRLDGEKFGVKRHEPTSNAPVLGVISTAPGTTLGYEWKRPDILAQQKPVALVGRVPIKVTNENGAIMPGDFLVASATQAGYAMKATKAGPVIGQALDKLTGTTGSITAFIKPTNYNGVNIEDKIAGGLDFDYGDEDQTAQTSEQMLEHLIAQLDELDYDNLSQINTDLVIAGAEVVSPNVTTQTLRTDFLSSATADGSLTVASATIMNGGLIVDEIGSVGGLLSMMSDVEFFGTPYFTVDTAGFAVIKAGVQSVDVTFSREYLAQPIVNASVSFEQDVDQSVLDEEAREVLKADAIAAAQTFLAEGVSYVITNKSKFGFTIVLSKPAPTDVKMSWTALAVRNASTFMSLDTPEGFVAGAGDPGDGVGDTPPGDGSGDGSGDGGTPPPGDGSGGETPPPSDPPPSDPPSGDGSGDGGIGG